MWNFCIEYPDDEFVAASPEGYGSAKLSEPDRVILHYVAKLTLDATLVSIKDMTTLACWRLSRLHSLARFDKINTVADSLPVGRE